MIALLQIPVLALIRWIAGIHAKKFAANIKIGPWWHFWWSVVYAIPCAITAWLCHSWLLAVAFAIERFVVYNPLLNRIRNKSFFYIVADNSKPGFWDKIEVFWAGFYPYIWGLAVLGYIFIQIKFII